MGRAKALTIAGMTSLLILASCAEAVVQEADAAIYNLSEQISAEVGFTVPPLMRSGASDDPFSHWQGLYMYAEAGGVTPTGLRLSVINNSEELSFGFGLPFRIEQYDSGEWQQVPFTGDVFWHLPLLIIAPNSVRDEDINWEHMHGQLQPGQYRIVRDFIEFGSDGATTTQDRNEIYLYAPFTIEEDWETAREIWLTAQDALAAAAYSRFDGLDLEISEHSPRGLSFTLTNNNTYYSYIINGIFMGWENRYPEGGFSGAVEYSIFNNSWSNPSWPFGQDVRLQPGESISLDVDWYYAIGNLSPRAGHHPDWPPPYPYRFDLTADVTLDVDEEYKQEHFRRAIPGLPGAGHRITAHFELR